MVEVTKQAGKALNKELEEKGEKSIILKIAMMGYGWGGPRLGLVQAGSEDDTSNSIQVDKIQIVWDDQVNQMTKMYGKLVVDYMKSVFGGKIHVGFSGVSC